MVQLSCGYKCLQILLVIFNIITFVCGIGLIVVGSLAIVNVDKYSETTNSTLRAFTIFIIALGCLLFALGFFGFCGACKKNVCCLTIFVILLALTVLAEIAGAIAGFVLRNKVEQLVLDGWQNAIGQYGRNPQLTKTIDAIQHELHCCGATSPSDYGAKPPDSCLSSPGVYYQQGCVQTIELFIKKYFVAIAVSALIFALLQIVCMIMAICVINAIKRNEAE